MGNVRGPGDGSEEITERNHSHQPVPYLRLHSIPICWFGYGFPSFLYGYDLLIAL
jgi:hypothetical protein